MKKAKKEMMKLRSIKDVGGGGSQNNGGRSGFGARGQIQKVFIYIMVLFVIGAVLGLGFKFILGLMSQGCDVQKVQFISDIESALEKYDSYGSLEVVSFNAPCNGQEICFADARRVGDESFSHENEVIQDSVSSGVKKNVFLITDGSTEPLGFSKKIIVPEDNKDVVCIEQQTGKFTIKFEGAGSTIEISHG